MTQPRRAYQDAKGDRWYFSFDPNSRYYGVTSAISVLDKSLWLVPWASKVVAENAVEIMMDLDALWGESEGYIDLGKSVNYISAFNDGSDTDWEDLAKMLAQSPTWERDLAGDRGDAVHEYIECILEFSKGQYSKAAAYYEEHPPEPTIAGRCFPVLSWLDENEVNIIEVEATLYNDTHEYAGSCDIIATVNGVLRYIDIKTSGTISDTFALQVAAYAHGEYIISDTDERKPVPTGEAEGGVLQLLEGKAKFIDIDVSDDMFEAFLSCLLIKQLWFDGAKKGAIGKTLWQFPPKKTKKALSKTTQEVE